jgi:hypothetical protein
MLEGFSQERHVDVGVNLGLPYITVAKSCLNSSEIRASIEQMRRERMPKLVRRDASFNASSIRPAFQKPPECPSTKRLSSRAQEKVG